MSTKDTCPCGQTPIQARVGLWTDGWAPSGRDCHKARSIFEGQFRTMLGEVFDEVNRRAEADMIKTGSREGSLLGALCQVRAELCGERRK